jgi:hypothetical protein
MVLKELLQFARGPSPFVTDEFEILLAKYPELLSPFDQRRVNRFLGKYNLWIIINV